MRQGGSRVMMTKYLKKLQLKKQIFLFLKIAFYLSLDPHKGLPSYRRLEVFIPQEKTSSNSS
jgi:hypothetical protein